MFFRGGSTNKIAWCLEAHFRLGENFVQRQHERPSTSLAGDVRTIGRSCSVEIHAVTPLSPLLSRDSISTVEVYKGNTTQTKKTPLSYFDSWNKVNEKNQSLPETNQRYGF